MSDTPRTDDFLAHQGYDGLDQFTRSLERENTRLRNALETARGAICSAAIKDGTLALIEDALANVKSEPRGGQTL